MSFVFFSNVSYHWGILCLCQDFSPVTSQSSHLSSSICWPPDGRIFLVKREIWMDGRSFIRCVLFYSVTQCIYRSQNPELLAQWPYQLEWSSTSRLKFSVSVRWKLSFTSLPLLLGRSSCVLVWVTKNFSASGNSVFSWGIHLKIENCWQTVVQSRGALQGNTAFCCFLNWSSLWTHSWSVLRRINHVTSNLYHLLELQALA